MPQNRIVQQPLDFPGRYVWLIVSAMLLVLPVVIDQQMKDTFREPKEIAFRAGAILLCAVMIFGWTSAQFRANWASLRTPVNLVLALILSWTVVTALTAQNRRLAVFSAFTVACSAIFFVATRLALRTRRTPVAIEILLAAPIVNAVLAILQEYEIWQPFHFPDYMGGHISTTALLGNPNDVAMFLLLPAVTSIVGAVCFGGWHRAFFIASALTLLAAIFVCRTRTVFIAFGFALLVMIATQSRRVALVLASALIVILVPLLLPSTTAGQHFRLMMKAARERQYDLLFSERMPAYLTAFNMFRDHPILGVGPGSYKYLYMPYRVALAAEYPAAMTKGSPLNFREAHNDHLQVLAETGAPGYALYLAALAALVFRRQTSNAEDDAARFARGMRLPGVIAASLVSLAQFPLQLAGPRMVFIYLAAMIVTWDE